MAPFAGVGYLIANDILTDVAFALIEPSVKTIFSAPTGPGVNVIGEWDPSIYVGCLLVAGTGGDTEVIVVTAVTVGVNFTANFVNSHFAGEPIIGATFPVRQPTDPFFTQAEMLTYLSNAVNDFLGECPIVIAVSTAVTVAPTAQNAALPSDCMQPVRVAANKYALRETSQSNLDTMEYRWQQAAATGPKAYFRDKTGLQMLGIWPRANNTTPLEIVYEQRGDNLVEMADGFLIPDPFLIYVKYRVLEYAYSKDGEQRNPGLARYYNGRYKAGLQISNMLLEAIMDPNLELAQ